MLTPLVLMRRILVLALVGLLTASLATVMTRSASAASPAPVEVRLDAITSSLAAPDGTPTGAVPTVLAAAGDEVTVTVSFYDSLQRPAFFSKDTRLVVTSDHGAVTNIDTLAHKGAFTAELTVSMPAPANQVRLTVTVPDRRTPFSATATDAQRFDVLAQLRFEDSTDNFEQGIGGDGNCTEATPENPVCGVVILPLGASSSQVLLSLGLCDDTGYSGCGDPRGSVIQTLADLSAYSATSPATMLVKCDKTLCGGGSIKSKHLSYTLGGNTPLAQAEACPAKGVVGTEPACVDYVQSKRDGSGDTYLYLLFVRDARVSVG